MTALALMFAFTGVFFMFTAALGVARLSDPYARLHCVGKSASLGVACLLAAAAIASNDSGVAIRATCVAIFFMLTGPIGCHALARAVHRSDNNSAPNNL